MERGREGNTADLSQPELEKRHATQKTGKATQLITTRFGKGNMQRIKKQNGKDLPISLKKFQMQAL